MAAKKAKRVRLVSQDGPHVGISGAEIVGRAEAMLDLLQLQDEELSIVLTGDEQIHELNRIYRGKDKPTDVLAFAQREGEFAQMAGKVLGDVVISIPTARKQARAAKHDALAEVTMLLAHGILHLLGWDHDTAAKDRKMRAETDRLVAAALKSHTRRRANVLSARAKPKRASRGKD